MKVYGLRTIVPDSNYLPVIGYHTSVQSAKEQAKEVFDKTAEWDIVQYDMPERLSLPQIVSLLNGDSISSKIDGTVVRDHLVYQKIVFENAAMKRYKKARRN